MAELPFSEPQYLRQKAHAQCMGLSFRLDELVEDFPGGTPKDFISALQLILEELKKLLATTTDDDVVSWIITLIEQHLNDYLMRLDNAHTAQTPRALVKILEKSAKKMGQDRSAWILVAPDYECGYTIEDQVPRLHSLLSSFLSKRAMSRIFRCLPRSVPLVQFPRIERDHVLNYAIFGHELGHPMVEKILNEYEASRRYQFQVKSIQQQLKQLQAANGVLREYRASQQQLAFRRVSRIFRRGLTEVLADAVGAFAFGPSALYASLDHLSTNRLDNPPSEDEYYPPNRSRHRFMYELLASEGHIATLRSIAATSELSSVRTSVPATLKYIEDIIAARDDVNAIMAEPLCAIAYRWIGLALPEILPDLRDKCARFIYSSAKASTEVPELLKRLALGIPPSERGNWPHIEAVDWRSSLLAGWLIRFAHTSRLDIKAADAVKRMVQINKLTMKGIEDAILAIDYKARAVR